MFVPVTHRCLSLCPRSWTRQINRTAERQSSWVWGLLRTLLDISISQGTHCSISASTHIPFFLFSNVFQYFFIPFTGVSSLLLQWLMLIQLKRCYCRGKCMHVHFLCYTCSSFTWIFIFYLCLCVLTRVIALVQRQMVMANFTQDFINKLQEFCKKLHFPAELRNMRNRYACPLTSRVTCYMYMLLL